MRGPDPLAAVPARQFPGDHRDQDRIVRAGQDLSVAQGLQAARRSARPDNQPVHAEHGCARADRKCAARRQLGGAAEAIAGAVEPAWGALTVGALFTAIRNPASRSPTVTNIAGQAPGAPATILDPAG